MSDNRYQELMSRYFDEEISSQELEELVALLDRSKEMRENFTRQLLLAGLMSQLYVQGRSPESFLEGFKMRLRATESGEALLKNLHERIEDLGIGVPKAPDSKPHLSACPMLCGRFAR